MNNYIRDLTYINERYKNNCITYKTKTFKNLYIIYILYFENNKIVVIFYIFLQIIFIDYYLYKHF